MNQHLENLLKAAGWQVTNDRDENGYIIVKPTDESLEIKTKQA